MSKMANAFVERGHAVKIVFLQNAAGEPAYPLDARVELENCAGALAMAKKGATYSQLVHSR